MECEKYGQWIMVCCNMCVVLLSMKRDFVREMEKYENVYVAAKLMKFPNKGMREGWMVCVSVWLGPLDIEQST